MPSCVGRMRPNNGFQADVFAAADIPSTRSGTHHEWSR
jgi:hypothetical protein